MRLIDADEFISYLITRYGGNDCADDIIEDLYNQPSVDAGERKRGRWVKVGHFGRSYKCNQCGNYLDFDGVNVGRGDANFCPNCGADMRGEANDLTILDNSSCQI